MTSGAYCLFCMHRIRNEGKTFNPEHANGERPARAVTTVKGIPLCLDHSLDERWAVLFSIHELLEREPHERLLVPTYIECSEPTDWGYLVKQRLQDVTNTADTELLVAAFKSIAALAILALESGDLPLPAPEDSAEVSSQVGNVDELERAVKTMEGAMATVKVVDRALPGAQPAWRLNLSRDELEAFQTIVRRARDDVDAERAARDELDIPELLKTYGSEEVISAVRAAALEHGDGPPWTIADIPSCRLVTLQAAAETLRSRLPL